MKRMMMLPAAILLLCLAGATRAQTVAARADNAVDPKNNPGPVDLEKHPEVMAKVREMLYSGEMVYYNRNRPVDTSLDLSKHPEIVKAIINNPNNWSVILKAYRGNDTLTAEGKNKEVIRDILAYLIDKKVVSSRGDVGSFFLTADSFTVNNKTMPGAMQSELKARFIKSPDFVVYYGMEDKTGVGIFQKSDRL